MEKTPIATQVEERLHFPESAIITELFEYQVDRTPANVALLFNDSRLTYSQLNEQANQLAHSLRENFNIKSDEAVGIVTERSDRMIVAMLAILKAGGAYLPIDPTNPIDRIQYMVKDSKMKVMLTENPMFTQFQHDFSGVQLVDIWDEKYFSNKTENLARLNKPSDLVYIIYTSGSTGLPKGVMIEHRNLVHYVNAFLHIFPLTEADVYMQVSSSSFDAFAEELYPAILSGAKVVMTTKKQVWDINQLAQKLNDFKANYLSCTPALITALNDVYVPQNPITLLCGGDTIKVEHISNLISKASIFNGYGPTETTICATYYQITQPVKNPIPIGKAILGYKAYIIDNSNSEAAIGVPGELCIAGEGLARGYLGREELTAEKFTDNPINPGERIYHTGDLCRYLPDGNIEFIGRIDGQVKIRGFRIELGEIEKTIHQYPEIKDCVVTVMENEGDKELAAYIIPKNRASLNASGYSIDIGKLLLFLKSKLADYMIPLYFVEMEQFPVTTNDKIDRKNLPIPEKKYVGVRKTIVPPTSDTEKAICNIWKEILNLNKISIDDNFFELGGHSLMAFRLINKINDTLAVQFPLNEFFNNPTIEKISKLAEKLTKENSVKIKAQPISKTGRNKPLVLSPGQESLWFITEFNGKSPLYNIPMRLNISGKLDKNKLSDSLNEVLKRHEGLRTTFTNIEGEPFQVINDFVYQPLGTEDIAGLTYEEIQARLSAEADKTFDLSIPFLVRWKLYRISGEKNILFLVFHHIISDGWTINLFFKELEYYFNRQENTPPLPELEFSYPDYAHWIKNRIETGFFNEQLAYWEKKLGTNPKPFSLPTDKPRPPVQTYTGNIAEINLSYDLTQALKQFAHKNGKTLFMTLLAAFKVLLLKITNEPEISLGSPAANRNPAETESMMGYFVNSLVLKTDLSGNPNFLEVLSRIQKTTLEAYANQQVPFEMLVAHLAKKRDSMHHVLFQILFVLENATEDYPNLTGLKCFNKEIPTGTSKVDLSFILEEMNNGTNIKAEYNTDLYHETTIVKLLGQYQNILSEILINPEIPISQLNLDFRPKNVAETTLFTSQLANKSVVTFFEEQVQKTPDNIAVVINNEQMTYKQLNQKANRLARIIESNCKHNEPLIGILMDCSIDLPVAILAILKTGKAYLPLDPLYPEDRLKYMIEDTETSLILVTKEYKEFVKALNCQSIVMGSIQEQLLSEADSNLGKKISAEGLAYIMYTSGTTGKPNGVEIPHRGITRLVIDSNYFPFNAKHTFLQLAPISFDASTFEIWGALLHGSKLVLYPERIPSFLFLKKLIKDNNISCLWLTASLFNMVIEEDPEIISEIPYVLTGGEALSVKYINLAQRYAPNTQFINGYGPTESTTFACCYQIPPIEGLQLKSIPIGKAISNTETYILSPDLKLVEPGQTGELYIGGMGLAKGYHKRPELTSQKFIKNPFDETGNSKLYKSGDLCRVNDDGNIEFIGRVDNQVKLRGFRIELDEIENCLLQHECIKDCVVALKKTSGVGQLVAYYTTEGCVSENNRGQTVSEQVKNHLKEYLAKNLPAYMIPNYFIELEKFPLNANGKTDRSKLPEPLTYVETDETEIAEELSETEIKIAHIWEEVLNLKNVKPSDNFFSIGGHSLIATKIVYKVNKIFGGNLLVSALFQSPTLREFAIQVQQTEKHEIAGEIIQIKPGFGKPVFLFSGIDGNPFTFTKLAKYYQTEQPLYFIQYPAGSSKEIKFKTLEEYINGLVVKIKTIQPTGPYYIAGYSLGGRFAFETAVQLQQAGETIKLLAILSALPPLFTKNTNPFVNFLLVESDVFFKVSFSLKLKYLRFRVTHLFERFFRKLSHSTDNGKFENVHLFVDVDEEIEKYLGMYNLWRNYAIKFNFKGNVLLIRESGLDEDLQYTSYYFDQVYPDYHWSKYVDGKISIESVPFDHNLLLEEPYVQEIAKILNNYINLSE